MTVKDGSDRDMDALARQYICAMSIKSGVLDRCLKGPQVIRISDASGRNMDAFARQQICAMSIKSDVLDLFRKVAGGANHSDQAGSGTMVQMANTPETDEIASV